MYLDTTYCNPIYNFPKQSACFEASIICVERHAPSTKGVTSEKARMSNWMKKLILFGSYSIGKERVYLEVAKFFDLKVYVDKERMKMLKCLRLPKEDFDRLTCDESETPLRVVSLGKITYEGLTEFNEAHKKKNNGIGYTTILGFRPTGWTFGKCGGYQILSLSTPVPI